MEKTTLYLPADLRAELRAVANRERRAQAEVVRDALARYFVDNRAPMPTSIGIVDGPDDGKDQATVKRELREQWAEEFDRRYKEGVEELVSRRSAERDADR